MTTTDYLISAALVLLVIPIVGMASRAGFQIWAAHSGSATIARFSRDNLIPGLAEWTAALLLMALAQVVGRLAVVRFKARRITTVAAPAAA